MASFFRSGFPSLNSIIDGLRVRGQQGFLTPSRAMAQWDEDRAHQDVPQKSSKLNCLPPTIMIPFWVPGLEAEVEFHKLELSSGSGGPGGNG